MALTRSTVVGIVPEVTEGTYVTPTNTDLLQIVDFPAHNPEVEKLDRNLIKGSIGRLKPLHGIRSGTIELSVELRSGGVVGGVVQQPEAHELMLSALGRYTAGGNATVDVGSTDTDIELLGGEGAQYEEGDIVHILGEIRAIRSISTDTVTLNRALDKGAPASSTVFVGGYTYKPANTGHNPLSVTIWYGDEWEARGVGCRVSAMSFADFSTGQIPKLNFTLEMLNWDEVAGSSPASPVYNDTPPPVAVNGTIYKDTTDFCVNAVELSIASTVTAETCINDAGGRSRLFVTDRMITGTVDPQVDATNIGLFADFRDNVDFELEVSVATIDSSGDKVAGEGVGVWCPYMNFTGMGFADQEGTVKHELPISAHESSTLQDDIRLGFC
jgi:hypothetical protein